MSSSGGSGEGKRWDSETSERVMRGNGYKISGMGGEASEKWVCLKDTQGKERKGGRMEYGHVHGGLRHGHYKWKVWRMG